MSELVDAPQALELLRQVVAEKGEDYVYPDELKDVYAGCEYMIDGQPACIVGHVFHKLRPETPWVENGVIWDSDGNQLDWAVQTFTPAAQQMLLQAQMVQDGGETWGLALATSEEWMAEHYDD